MSSERSVVLCLSMLLSALVICAGDALPRAPGIAPAALPAAVVNALDVVERVSDTYTLDVYVWRDSQPLIITGNQQELPPGLPLVGANNSCMQATRHSALRKPDYQITLLLRWQRCI